MKPTFKNQTWDLKLFSADVVAMQEHDFEKIQELLHAYKISDNNDFGKKILMGGSKDLSTVKPVSKTT